VIYELRNAYMLAGSGAAPGSAGLAHAAAIKSNPEVDVDGRFVPPPDPHSVWLGQDVENLVRRHVEPVIEPQTGWIRS